jgi:hypothetical protein
VLRALAPVRASPSSPPRLPPPRPPLSRPLPHFLLPPPHGLDPSRQDVIRKGDLLLNRIQKLSRIIDIE